MTRKGGQWFFALLLALGVSFPGIMSTAGAASIVIDASTGGVVSWDRPNHLWYPASLTKLMTVYIALAEIKAGHLQLDEPLSVSPNAAAVSPVSAPGRFVQPGW